MCQCMKYIELAISSQPLSGNVSPENISPLGLFFQPLSGSAIKIGKALSAFSVTSRTFANWYCFHQNQTPDPNTPQNKQTETRSKMFFCFKFIEFLVCCPPRRPSSCSARSLCASASDKAVHPV